MSIDALPVFLLDLFWTPLLYVGGVMWCIGMAFALLWAWRHVSKSD
jgi:hypothetical protein